LVWNCFDFIQSASVLVVWTASSVVMVVVGDSGSMAKFTPPSGAFTN